MRFRMLVRGGAGPLPISIRILLKESATGCSASPSPVSQRCRRVGARNSGGGGSPGAAALRTRRRARQRRPKQSPNPAVPSLAETVANTYRVVVGRLLEVRIAESMRTPADVDAWFDGVRAASAQVPPGQRQVVAADWRACPIMSDEAAERAVLRLRHANLVNERSAALASAASPIAVLQFLRLCRSSDEAGNRRLFSEVEEMSTWLAEVLTDAERDRLRAFLAEHDPTSSNG